MKYISSFPLTAEQLLLSRAFSFGDGVFETMLNVKGRVPLWNLHWQRLQQGLSKLSIECPSKEKLEKDLNRLGSKSQNSILKLFVVRSGQSLGYACSSNQSEFIVLEKDLTASPNDEEMGVSSVCLSQNQALAGIKHLNRLEQVLAAQSIQKSNFNDALMCDTAGNVIETTCKNVVFVKGGQLFTPCLKNSGVYGVALRWLEAQGYELNWQNIPLQSVKDYDSMMVCNAIRGFAEIKSIATVAKFDKVFEDFEKIKQMWDETVLC